MGGGRPQPVTQTTQQILSPEQRQLMELAMPGVEQFAAQAPVRYPGTQIAGFDPLQTAGQEMALQGAGAQAGLASGAADANQFLLNDIWNPASNPNLQGAIDAAIRPVTQRYQETVLPGIRDEFQGAGQQFGGSRRGVAEGIAGRGYLDTVADTSSKIVQDQYGNNLSAMLKGLALIPTTSGAQVTPGLTTSGVGDVRQAMSQAQLGEDVSEFNFENYAPFLKSKEIMALLSGLPGGGVTSTANQPQQSSLMQGLGLGISGLGALGSLGGAGGISALLPFLAMSDRRFKIDIEPVGKLFDGTTVYRYRLIGSPTMQIGLMADEVDPKAVVEIHGAQLVNYEVATDKAVEVGEQNV